MKLFQLSERRFQLLVLVIDGVVEVGDTKNEIDDEDQFPFFEGLGEIGIGSGFARLDGIVALGIVSRHEDHRGMAVDFADLFTDFKPVHSRHLDIAQDDVRFGGSNDAQTFFARDCLKEFKGLRAKRFGQDLLDDQLERAVVVDAEKFLGGLSEFQIKNLRFPAVTPGRNKFALTREPTPVKI